MTLKNIFRNVARFLCRIYWANRLGELGQGVIIARNSIWYNPKAIALGSHVLIKKNCQLSALNTPRAGGCIRLRIGDESSLQQGCKITAAESIVIGNKVMIADNVFITDHNHIFNRADMPAALVRDLHTEEVVIEDGCWLGYGCVILKGVHIGERSVIGANAVVTRDIPPYSVAVGNPARVIRKIDVPK